MNKLILITLLFCSNAYAQSSNWSFPGDGQEVKVSQTELINEAKPIEAPNPASLWMRKVDGTNLAYPMTKSTLASDDEKKRGHEWMLTVPEYAEAYRIYLSNPSTSLYTIENGMCGPFPKARTQKIEYKSPYLTEQETKSIEQWRDTNPIFSQNYQCHLVKYKRARKIEWFAKTFFSPEAVRDQAMRSQIRTGAIQLRRDLGIPEPKD